MHKTGEKFVLGITANSITLTSCYTRSGGGLRSGVVGVSRQSKTRLMDLLNSMLWDSLLFVTLTYKKNQLDGNRAYDDLRALHKRACYAFGREVWIWKREKQKRGAYHFHLFLFDSGACRSWLSANWSDVTGNEGSVAHRRYGTHVVQVGRLGEKDAGVLVSYLAKYASKDGDTSGRAWGVLGRHYARRVASKVNVSMLDAGKIVDAILKAGGVKVTDDLNPVVSYKLYMGHLGKICTPDRPSVTEWLTRVTNVDIFGLSASVGDDAEAYPNDFSG